MITYIALLRGINVGGKNKLPMADLVKILEVLGAQDVKTYIQSGNVVFQVKEVNTDTFSTAISHEIEKQFGFAPKVLLMTEEEFDRAMDENPFPVPDKDGNTLHLGFLATEPENVDILELSALKTESEHYCLTPKVFYLFAPDGVGKSRLTAAAEKIIGVEMTDRNWNTVCKLKEMVEKQ
ncbi:MAG: hypothetical protein CVU42_08720 [Chloroflexi bacterium HGW-Chloroflexi-4]|jgi:uncharacterized protein (DUF1697 family)|nr:MAG: hypothetical protein CVU42_08720 [Chloroflexi bacterium HGW-Chloroflexi-4]